MVANRFNPLVLHPCDEGDCSPFNGDGTYWSVVEPGSYFYRIPAANGARSMAITGQTTETHASWHMHIPRAGSEITPSRSGPNNQVLKRVTVPAGADYCFALDYTDERAKNPNTERPDDYYPGPYVRFYVRVPWSGA